MRIEVIHYKDDLLGVGVHPIDQIFYLICPINCCTMLMHTNVVPASKGFYKSEDAAGPLSYILGIHFLIVTGTHCPGFSGFSKKLIRLFVHTDNRDIRIIGKFIQIKDIFHAGYEFCIRFVGEAPVVAAVRSKFVFLENAVWLPC